MWKASPHVDLDVLKAKVDLLSFFGCEEVVVVPIAGSEGVEPRTEQVDAVDAFRPPQGHQG